MDFYRVLLQFTKQTGDAANFQVSLSEDLHNIESISVDSVQINSASTATVLLVNLGVQGLTYETISNDVSHRGFVLLLDGATTIFQQPETRQLYDMTTAGGGTIKKLSVSIKDLTPGAGDDIPDFTGISLLLRFNRREDGPAVYRPMKADQSTSAIVTKESVGARSTGHRFK